MGPALAAFPPPRSTLGGKVGTSAGQFSSSDLSKTLRLLTMVAGEKDCRRSMATGRSQREERDGRWVFRPTVGLQVEL